MGDNRNNCDYRGAVYLPGRLGTVQEDKSAAAAAANRAVRKAAGIDVSQKSG